MQIHQEALKEAKAAPLWYDPDIVPEVLQALTSDQQCELLIVGGGEADDVAEVRRRIMNDTKNMDIVREPVFG